MLKSIILGKEFIMSKKKNSQKGNQEKSPVNESSHAAKQTAKGVNEDKRSAKKAIVLGDQRKSRIPMLSTITLAIVLIGGGFFYVFQQKGETAQSSTLTASNTASKTLTHPAEIFNDGKARHFSFAAEGGITVKYFVLKSSDGVIRAAFDACDVCWPAGKGYYQSGDVMVCRNCGRRFASVRVNEVKGGCNPAPLNRKVEDGKVVLQVADILQGKSYFDFSKRG
jgi:uncharacterized membrane protein